jgi:alpha-galactosidase
MSRDDIFIRERLILHPADGAATFVYQAQPVLRRASAEAHYRTGGIARTLSLRGADSALDVGREQVCWSRANADICLDWHILLGADDMESIVEVKNTGSEPVQLDSVIVLEVDAARGGALDLGSPPNRWSFYKHGWQSWAPTFARHTDNGLYINPGGEEYIRKHVPHPDSGTADLSSEWFTVVSGLDSPAALLAGFTDGRFALSDVALYMAGGAFQRLAATCYADGIVLQPGERFLSEPLMVAFSEDPLDLLEQYADRVAARMNARVPACVPTGWCTWYYFYGENTAADVAANAAQIKKQRLPLDYVLIDDGYQQAIGDWLRIRADRFPDGMKAAADGIRAAGLRPGIWLAPFGVSADSQTYAEHPDWTLKNADGSPVLAWQHWGADIYALDLTQPEVLDWVERVFRVMSEDWGYDLFKIDFAFAAAADGLRHDPTATRAMAYRQGIERIRQAVGGKFLLGCGAPQLPSVGVVDAMRVSPDVSFNWDPIWADLSAPAGSNAMRNTLARYFMQGRWWLNDGDCILVRTRDDQSDLVLNEMRSLVTFIALSGGLALDSDNLPTVRPGRLKYLKMALPPSGIAARPVDLFKNENPRHQAMLVEKPWGQWWIVSLMNWRDKTTKTEVSLRDLGLPEGKYHVYNFWRQRYLGIRSDKLAFRRHQPHESIVLLLKPVSDQPDLLTSTFHITQGAVEIGGMQRIVHGPSGQTLRVDMEKSGTQRGQLIFAAPASWRATEARVDGRKWPFRALAGGMVALRFRLKERALLEVDFVRES